MSDPKGLDLDNYDNAVAVQTFHDLGYDYGFNFAIIGTQIGLDGRNYTDIQKQNALEAGWRVPAHYEFLYWTDNEQNDFDRMKHAASFGKPVLIDAETEKAGWTPARFVDRMFKSKQVLISEGLFGGWYSRAEWWNRVLGDLSMSFRGDTGWGADYPYLHLPPTNYPPAFQTSETPAFGGLNMVIWQYHNACYDHPNFDMNIALESWVAPVVNPTPPDDPNITLSIAAARFDLIAALSDGRLIARHNDDKSAVKVVDPSVPGGQDLTDWIPLKKGS